MEYFGSRLVWSSLDNITDPDSDPDILGQEIETPNPTSINALDEAPNEIEFANT